MRGTDPPRCRKHLGVSREVARARYEVERIARARFEDEQRARRRHGLPDGADVMASLLHTYEAALAWQDVCKSMLGGLEEVRYKSAGAGEQLRAEVRIWERSLDRTARIGADLVRLGIEDRASRLSDRQNAAIAGAIERALLEVAAAHNLTLDAGVRATVARHLREVSA